MNTFTALFSISAEICFHALAHSKVDSVKSPRRSCGVIVPVSDR